MKKRPNTHISAIFNELNISLFKFSNKYEAGVELIAFQDEEYFKVKYVKLFFSNSFLGVDKNSKNFNEN
jgi:hypothetical protein